MDLLASNSSRGLHESLDRVWNTTAVWAAGLEKVASEKFELILMDTCLPVLDSSEWMYRLKADSAPKFTFAIALTTQAATQDDNNAVKTVCDDYNAKPIDLPRPFDKIRSSYLTEKPDRSSRRDVRPSAEGLSRRWRVTRRAVFPFRARPSARHFAPSRKLAPQSGECARAKRQIHRIVPPV